MGNGSNLGFTVLEAQTMSDRLKHSPIATAQASKLQPVISKRAGDLGGRRGAIVCGMRLPMLRHSSIDSQIRRRCLTVSAQCCNLSPWPPLAASFFGCQTSAPTHHTLCFQAGTAQPAPIHFWMGRCRPGQDCWWAARQTVWYLGSRKTMPGFAVPFLGRRHFGDMGKWLCFLGSFRKVRNAGVLLRDFFVQQRNRSATSRDRFCQRMRLVGSGTVMMEAGTLAGWHDGLAWWAGRLETTNRMAPWLASAFLQSLVLRAGDQGSHADARSLTWLGTVQRELLRRSQTVLAGARTGRMKENMGT
ncbi:hypothetical protein B0T25DRAFT_544508 [Lasiosphaeria hispida]|uniref:Uncharacterized protein n=1 Tax=Lasiosphaeria hispida TaxID=260671 RepID=A0AAJ0MEG1_9PEZI|nr:hypothetical protein B0T25DRAFT_544508 [Lasiosphaeria hispida]